MTPEEREQRDTAAVAAQEASRSELTRFLKKQSAKVQEIYKGIKSEWFGRPDEELKGWIERGRAISEIKDSIGYRLIMEQTQKEIQWAMRQLETCDEKDLMEMRCYLKCLRFLKDFILTTERNADISSRVLAGRAENLGKETFVAGGLNDRSGNN